MKRKLMAVIFSSLVIGLMLVSNVSATNIWFTLNYPEVSDQTSWTAPSNTFFSNCQCYSDSGCATCVYVYRRPASDPSDLKIAAMYKAYPNETQYVSGSYSQVQQFSMKMFKDSIWPWVWAHAYGYLGSN